MSNLLRPSLRLSSLRSSYEGRHEQQKATPGFRRVDGASYGGQGIVVHGKKTIPIRYQRPSV